MGAITSIGQLILRALQLIFVACFLGLTASLVAKKGPFDSLPALTGYCMFVACYGALALLVGFVAAFVEALSGLVMAVIDGLAVLFFLAGGIAVAVKIGVDTCNPGTTGKPPNQYFNSGRFWTPMIVDGWLSSEGWAGDYSDWVSRCRISQALCAFEWFAFGCFAASLVLDLIGGGSLRGRRGGGSTV